MQAVATRRLRRLRTLPHRLKSLEEVLVPEKACEAGPMPTWKWEKQRFNKIITLSIGDWITPFFIVIFALFEFQKLA
jgi:hypothetical protein